MRATKPQPSGPRPSLPSGRIHPSRVLAGWLACWMTAVSWTPTAAAEIGRVQEVHPEVLAIEEGKDPWQLQKNDGLERGLRIRLTERESFLLVHLYGGPPDVPYPGPKDERIEKPREYRIDGVLRLAGKGQMDLGKQSLVDRIVTTLEMEWGEFRLRLRPGRTHDVKGNTREAALTFNGTDVRVLADPLSGTFVAVDEGAATVQAFAGGEPVNLTSGQWVLVPPGGLATRPAPLDGVDILKDPPLLDCCDFRIGPP